MGGSVEKSPIKDMAKKLSNLSQSGFALENPTHWGLETAVCPIFLKPYLDVFAVFFTVTKDKFVPYATQVIYAQKINITY